MTALDTALDELLASWERESRSDAKIAKRSAKRGIEVSQHFVGFALAQTMMIDELRKTIEAHR